MGSGQGEGLYFQATPHKFILILIYMFYNIFNKIKSFALHSNIMSSLFMVIFNHLFRF